MTALSDITSRYRIFYEESSIDEPRDEKPDYQELHGVGDTRIYKMGDREDGLWLAVSTENSRRQFRLRAIPGLRVHNGSVFLFPAAMLEVVAEAIGARKKRQVTEALRERGRALAARWSRKND